jgi:hypothetical protein
MNRNRLSLVLSLAMLAAPAAFANMRYVTVPATPILTVPDLLHPPVNNFSGCSSASSTIAVGYEIYAGGFRMLCADAGVVGFWTTPVESALVGTAPDAGERFLCPSGTALGGVQYIEGLVFPFPLCGELIPDLTSGTVRRTVLLSIDNVAVEKLSKGPPQTPGVVSCGPAGYVQTLQASRNAAGALTGLSAICNAIVTDAISTRAHVDLTVKTIHQTAVLGRNATQTFSVAVFNLGTAVVPASNVSLELRFDGSVWQIQPFGNLSCNDILGHAGVVDLLVVGKRCTITGSVAAEDGGISVNFQLSPLGPDALRPPTSTPKPIVSVKVGLVNETLLGADVNDTNNTAAFPQVLQ